MSKSFWNWLLKRKAAPAPRQGRRKPWPWRFLPALEPLDLLHVLQDIEQRAGRVRSVRWGERTLDLDLLLFGDQVIATSELCVPHPLMASRRFVLEPLTEVPPQGVDPVTGATGAELLANLERLPRVS